MIVINTTEDLIDYLELHWDDITDFQYCRILESTLKVYATGKPKSFDVAKEDIIRFAEFPLIDRPLFIGIDEQN